MATETIAKYFMSSAEAGAVTGFAQSNHVPETYRNLQNGTGANIPMLDCATPCVYTPAVIVVMSVPLMYITESGQATPIAWVIKDLVESHSRNVTGIDVSYQLNQLDNAGVGMDGQNFQVPGKTTRQQQSPQFTWTELMGNLVVNTIKKWMFDINHPDTNAACAQAIYPGAWSMSAYSMSMLVIQFDATMRPDHILDGVYFTNMWPTNTGDFSYKRELGQYVVPERAITFTSIQQHSDATKAVAMAVAEQLQLHKHNYNIAPVGRTNIDKAIMDGGVFAEHEDKMDWATMHPQNLGFDARDNSDGTSDTFGSYAAIIHPEDGDLNSVDTGIDGSDPFAKTKSAWNVGHIGE